MIPSRQRFLAVTLSVWISGFAITLPGQVATFSAKIELVRVDALITENGHVIRGLQPDDFEVRDNGVLQQVDFVSFAELPLHVVIALDASNSLSGERVGHLRSAGLSLVEALRTEDRAALLTFSHFVSLRQGLTGDLALIRRSLEALEPRGETSLSDATYAAMKLAQPDGASRTLIIVFSDGQDTSSWLTAERVIESAHSSDATIYGVTVRGTRRPEFLRDVAAATGGSVIEIESTRDLGGTFARVLDEFRQRYVIGFSPRNVARGGLHKLQLGIKGRRADIAARSGYFAGP